MDRPGVCRLAAACLALVAMAACAGPAAPPASQVAVPSATVPAPTASPTAAPQVAAIAAFVDRVTSGDLSYRVSFRGDARVTTDVLPIKGTLDVAGADFATSFTYDFSDEYIGVGTRKVQVRSVGGKGWIKRQGKDWAVIKGYDAGDSATPFRAITTTADVRYLGSIEKDGDVLHRLSVPDAVLIHPNTIPFEIRKEQIDRTTLEVVIDATGRPVSGTWTLRGQARVGAGIGQLQRVLYELALDFSKVGDAITIKKP